MRPVRMVRWDWLRRIKSARAFSSGAGASTEAFSPASELVRQQQPRALKTRVDITKVSPKLVEQAVELETLDFQLARPKRFRTRRQRLLMEEKDKVLKERGHLIREYESQISKMIQVAKATKYGTAQLREIERLFEKIKPVVGVSVWNQLLEMYIEKGLMHKVLFARAEMDSYKVVYNLQTFEILFLAFQRHERNSNEAISVLVDLQKAGFSPRPFMLKGLVSLICKRGRDSAELANYFENLDKQQEAWSPTEVHLLMQWLVSGPRVEDTFDQRQKLVTYFQRIVTDPDCLDPDSEMYTRFFALLDDFDHDHDHKRLSKSERLDQLLLLLKEGGIPIHRQAFHAALKRCWNPSRLSKTEDSEISALACLDLLNQHNIPLSPLTFTLMVELLLDQQQIDAAWRVLYEQRSRGLSRPSSKCIAAITRATLAVSRGGGGAGVVDLADGVLGESEVSDVLPCALGLLERFEELNIRNAIVFDLVLREIVERVQHTPPEELNSKELETAVTRLLRKMKQMQLKPSLHTFTAMIHIRSLLGDATGMLKVLIGMKQANVTPDSETYRIVIHGLCATANYLPCVKMFAVTETFGNKIAKQPLLLPVLMSYARLARTEEAEEVLLAMLSERNILPAQRHWASVAVGWVNEGQIKRLVKLYTKMRDPSTYAAHPAQGFCEEVMEALVGYAADTGEEKDGMADRATWLLGHLRESNKRRGVATSGDENWDAEVGETELGEFESLLALAMKLEVEVSTAIEY